MVPGIEGETTTYMTGGMLMTSMVGQVLSGGGSCENICDRREEYDEDKPMRQCVKTLDGGTKLGIVFLAFFPVCFAILMAVFCDCKTLRRPCCDEKHRNKESGRVRKTLLRSSIIVVFFVAIFAFLVTFFALHDESNPCATGLGQCTTISCICGNTYFQGYVFMFVSLTLCAVLLIQDLHREINRVVGVSLVPRAFNMEMIVAVGLLMVVFTGVFPTMEKEDGVDTGENTKSWAEFFHLFGIGIGCLILNLYANSVFMSCCCFTWPFGLFKRILSWLGCEWFVQRHMGTIVYDKIEEVPFFEQKRAYFWVWLFYVLFFGIANLFLPHYFSLSPVDTFDHCPKMGNLEYWGYDEKLAEQACNAWPMLDRDGA